MGKLGTGFDSDTLRQISSKIIATPIHKKLIFETIEEPNRTTWIEPCYLMDLEYASLSNNGTYREPVFKRIIHADTQVDILS
ncbi:MAG: hypothetical protein HKN68_10800, partial [Saprospiraceae bacterium]|nr:hypothetical protein [Saprospiraceae bacterium]